MADEKLLLRKMSELEGYLSQVREFSTLSLKAYENDWKAQRIVERTLQIMIEICTDAANHIISDRGYRVPKTYADTFRVLAEEGLMEANLSEVMEKMAGFRNIVVHAYDKIDAAIVIGILKNNLEDFVRFRGVILSIIRAGR